MAVGGYGNVTSRISIRDSDTTTTIFNVTATLANTEYSQALPADTKEFLIKNRTNGNMKLAFTSGQSGTLYMSIPCGAVYANTNFYSSQTLYFQVDKAATIVEIVAHT